VFLCCFGGFKDRFEKIDFWIIFGQNQAFAWREILIQSAFSQFFGPKQFWEVFLSCFRGLLDKLEKSCFLTIFDHHHKAKKAIRTRTRANRVTQAHCYLAHCKSGAL
jgi:hypothetical protein